MSWQKIFRATATALIIIVSLLFTVGVEAEIKTYDGVGRYVMSDFENQDIAKQRARYRAEKDAQKKAGVYVKSYSRSINSELTDNEVSAVMNQITNIVGEVKYDRKIETVDGEQVIIWTANLTANIDTNGIYEFIKRDEKDKVTIVQQNESFQDAIAKNENLIAELKTQYKNAKTQAEKDKLVDRLKQLDRDFLAEQKLEESHKFWGNYKKALKLCNEALELKPNFAKAYIYRGDCHSFMGHNDDLALADFNKAIELEPSASNYHQRAYFYKDLKNYDLALADYTKAIELEPSASNYRSRAFFYDYLKNYDLALADYNKMIELEPDDAISYSYRADFYKEFKNYDLALADYKKVIELEPDDAIVYSRRADFYKEFKKYDFALADYSKAIELDWLDEILSLDYFKRGTVYYNLGQYEQAIKDFDEAIKFYLEGSVTYNWRGMAYYNLGQYGRAIQDFDKAIQLNPKGSFAYKWCGESYKRLGIATKAQAYFVKAKELEA